MSKPTSEVVINCDNDYLHSIYADGDGIKVRVNQFRSDKEGVTLDFMQVALERSGFTRQIPIGSFAIDDPARIMYVVARDADEYEWRAIVTLDDNVVYDQWLPFENNEAIHLAASLAKALKTSVVNATVTHPKSDGLSADMLLSMIDD